MKNGARVKKNTTFIETEISFDVLTIQKEVILQRPCPMTLYLLGKTAILGGREKLRNLINKSKVV